MSIHSKYLIHWTGKGLNLEEVHIQESYLNRLKDICCKGLYMNRGRERIYGRGGTSITATISRVCFSEIRLSQVSDHAKLYGGLGIGFHRDFVIEREGNPVLYVLNGDNGVVIENFAHLHKSIKSNGQMLKELEIILGYLKNMSDRNDSTLKYYEEMEWRVVHLNRLEDKYISVEDRTKHIYTC